MKSAAGIEYSGTNTKVGIVTEKGEIVERTSFRQQTSMI